MLDDDWWERVDVAIKIMDLIISLLPCADQHILTDVHEGCDSMIESAKTLIYRVSIPSMDQ